MCMRSRTARWTCRAGSGPHHTDAQNVKELSEQRRLAVGSKEEELERAKEQFNALSISNKEVRARAGPAEDPVDRTARARQRSDAHVCHGAAPHRMTLRWRSIVTLQKSCA